MTGKFVRLRFAIITKSLREIAAGHRFRVAAVCSDGKLILVELPPFSSGQVLYLSKVPATDVEIEAVQPDEAQAAP